MTANTKALKKRAAASKRTARLGNASKKLSSVHRHLLASLVTVSPHAHTGQKLHRRHTSHGFLLLGLIVTGALLFTNLGSLRAFGVTQAGSVHVSVNVAGLPPSQGADITFPKTNSKTSFNFVQVQGTCPDQTLVVVYDNAKFAGSAICSQGAYSFAVQLAAGANILQAQNYDGLNQEGPQTTAVIVLREEASTPAIADPTDKPDTQVATSDKEVSAQTDPVLQPTPAIPAIPNACADLDESPVESARPVIAVGCLQQNVFAGETLKMPLLIKGGLAPFALAVDWGDQKQDLVTVLDNSKKTLAHTYATGGFHTIVMKATDSQGSSSQIQTAVSVNGETVTGTVANNVEQFVNTAKSIWVDAPVPLYFTALALTIGFWVGDVVQRMAESRATHVKRAAKMRRRHA